MIEVGCGDGRNFEHYPAAVELVLAVEPDPAARAEAVRRAAECATPVEVVDGVADRLPAADADFAAAVSCWYLCSVSDQAAALLEIRRVLVQGGELRFYEHVRADNPVFRGLQRLVDLLYWPRLLGGCRTALDSRRAICGAGFEITELKRGFHSSSLLTLPSAPFILGTATVSPSAKSPAR